MPLGSVICRKKLDEERGNDFLCGCPLCREAKRSEKDEGLFHSGGAGGTLRSQPEDDLSKAVGQGDTGFQSR